MRNKRKTIESLRRLAERPGTKAEGIAAQAALERLLGRTPTTQPFRAELFPRGTAVYYNKWAYPENDPCIVVGKAPKIIQGETWMRLRFNHLKQPRWVPVTSRKGSHISTTPLSTEEADNLYREWED